MVLRKDAREEGSESILRVSDVEPSFKSGMSRAIGEAVGYKDIN